MLYTNFFFPLKARDPQIKPPGDFYHPVWTNCGPITVPDGSIQGPINSTACTVAKKTANSFVRVTFNGNIRVTDCHDCCMRWYVSLNGEECVDPAPIEAVVYSTDAEQVNIHRAATITGETIIVVSKHK